MTNREVLNELEQRLVARVDSIDQHGPMDQGDAIYNDGLSDGIHFAIKALRYTRENAIHWGVKSNGHYMVRLGDVTRFVKSINDATGFLDKREAEIYARSFSNCEVVNLNDEIELVSN
ncbi:hypothetical protein ACBP45_07155 [Latilactobacillus sakei]